MGLSFDHNFGDFVHHRENSQSYVVCIRFFVVFNASSVNDMELQVMEKSLYDFHPCVFLINRHP